MANYPNFPSNYYTIKDVMLQFPVSEAYVRNSIRSHNFKTEYFFLNGYKVIGFDRTVYNLLCDMAKEYAIKVQRRMDSKIRVKTEGVDSDTIIKLRAEHPLVKNDNFFRLSFFPDVSLPSID